MTPGSPFYQFTTTLLDPIDDADSIIQVANAQGIFNPGSENAYNATPTYLQIDSEWLQVDITYQAESLMVPVIRGTDGSLATAHAAGASVLVTNQTPNSNP